MLHGSKAATLAEKTAKDTFVDGGMGIDLPEIKIKEDDIKKGIKILDLLTTSKIMSSKNEARRAIKNSGLKIDNIVLSDDTREIRLNDFKSMLIEEEKIFKTIKNKITDFA